jgi:hypothetical protein
MKSVWLYRIAAIVFVFFAAGHTAGFLTFRPPSPEGLAVWDAMNRVHFAFGGNSFTYAGFYTAFGLLISLSMIFSAFLSWHLSLLARRSPQSIGALGWAFFLLQLAGVALSWIYFALPQIAFSAAVAVCVGWAVAALPGAAPVSE